MTSDDDVAGCYDPAYEHDACGVAFVADLKRPASHRVVDLGLTALENLAHRGAFGADPGTGDGAGALVQLPHRLYAQVAGFDLPEAGGLRHRDGVPADRACGRPNRAMELVGDDRLRGGPRRARLARGAGRPRRRRARSPKRAAPSFSQVFLAPAPGRSGRGQPPLSGDALERRCFVVRKRVEHAALGVYFPSLSTRTIVYKGMLALPTAAGVLPGPHATSASRAGSPSCTRGSRPTRSRPGPWPIPTG